MLLLTWRRSGTFADDHVLVAIGPFIVDIEICGLFVHPTCAIFVVVVQGDAVLVLHTTSWHEAKDSDPAEYAPGEYVLLFTVHDMAHSVREEKHDTCLGNLKDYMRTFGM